MYDEKILSRAFRKNSLLKISLKKVLPLKKLLNLEKKKQQKKRVYLRGRSIPLIPRPRTYATDCNYQKGKCA